MKKHELPEKIDWPTVMSAPRYAGGHEEVMRAIFGPNAEVIAEWIQGAWQGDEAFAYRFPDGAIVIITDYFGSCSGCDAWEGAGDDEARHMIQSLVNSARLFGDMQDAINYCEERASEEAFEYPFRTAANLVTQLRGRLKEKQDGTTEDSR